MSRLLTQYREEMMHARAAEAQGDAEECWLRLERAHILSQPSPILHTLNHVAMLRLALRIGDLREALAQVVRVLLAGIASLLAVAPRGNPGRARVSLTARAAIPDDLAPLLDEERAVSP